jgi:hypothetical protein
MLDSHKSYENSDILESNKSPKKNAWFESKKKAKLNYRNLRDINPEGVLDKKSLRLECEEKARLEYRQFVENSPSIGSSKGFSRASKLPFKIETIQDEYGKDNNFLTPRSAVDYFEKYPRPTQISRNDLPFESPRVLPISTHYSALFSNEDVRDILVQPLTPKEYKDKSFVYPSYGDVPKAPVTSNLSTPRTQSPLFYDTAYYYGNNYNPNYRYTNNSNHGTVNASIISYNPTPVNRIPTEIAGVT